MKESTTLPTEKGDFTMDQGMIIYEQDQHRVEVRLDSSRDTIWLSQAQMAELFDKDSDTVGLHLKNIYKTGELEEDATTEESSLVRQEGDIGRYERSRNSR